jgi:hypothetical protein
MSQKIWNGSNTATSNYTQTITSSTSRSATAGETFQSSQTFLVYAQPFITNGRNYSQAAYVVADTNINEFFWSNSNSSGHFEDGATLTSVLFNSFDNQTKISTGSTRNYNATETWPNETVVASVFGGTNGKTATITAASGTLAPLSVTVLGAGTATALQVFNRDITEETFTYQTGLTSQQNVGSQDFYYTYSTQEEVQSYKNLGVAVRWDSASSVFSTLSHEIYVVDTIDVTSVSTRLLFRNDTQSSELAGDTSSWNQTERGITYNSVIENIKSISFLGGAQNIEMNGLKVAGPRAQLSPNLGFSYTEGLNYGGAELYYSIVSVEGQTLRTPLFNPITSSKASGVSKSTYVYDSSINGISGTSYTNENSTTTFSRSFSFIASQERKTGTFGSTQSLTVLMDSSELGQGILIGNKEAWSGQRGAFSIENGAVNITTESNNSTGTQKTYYSYNGEFTIGETQAVIEPGWAAKKVFNTSSPGISPRINVLISSFNSFTS